MYRGPVFGLPAHRNAVAVLALCLQGEMAFATHPRRADTLFAPCRSAFIEPGTLTWLRPGSGPHVFVYADALSGDVSRWRKQCRQRLAAGVSADLQGQDALIHALGDMPAAASGWLAARAKVQAVLGPAQRSGDARAALAVQALRDAPDAAHRTAIQARALGLSPSRFQHVFKASTGVPYRRFRNWMRLQAVLRAALSGQSLTAAALDAGFASSAHFSAIFKNSFGMSATQLLAAQPIWIDDLNPAACIQPTSNRAGAP